jgi:hypothetical protein
VLLSVAKHKFRDCIDVSFQCFQFA